jgi:uncharacterized membrane protein (UPF0127 family)
MKFIHEIYPMLITFLLLIGNVSCNESKANNPFKTYKSMVITLDSGEEIKTYIAHNSEEQALGLSLVKPDQFSNSDAMLFTGDHFQTRQFWMPETFFNLDLFFLGPDMEVLDIQRNLQHHTKRFPKKDVPLSKFSYCQHVLEMKTSSPISAKIKVGMILKGIPNLSQIVSGTHSKQ